MFELCIFDLDGTAVDTLDSLWHTGNACLEQLSLKPQPRANYQYYAGDGSVKLVQRILKDGGDVECSHFEEAFALYRKLFETGCMYDVKPFDGLPEAMDQMKEAGAKLCILSNKDHDNVCSVMEVAYPVGYFHKLLGYTGEFARKPSPESALHVAKEFGISPEKCMYVGDTNTDMLTGKNAGMYTVGVTWGFRTRQELEESGADAIAETPEELLNIFKHNI